MSLVVIKLNSLHDIRTVPSSLWENLALSFDTGSSVEIYLSHLRASSFSPSTVLVRLIYPEGQALNDYK